MKIGVDRTLALFAFVIVLAGSTLVVTRSLEAHSTTRAVSEISQQTGSKQTTSQSISTLLTRNLQDVFGENDAKRRRAASDEIYAEDIVFYETNKNIYRGRDEIDRVAGALRAQHPDFRYHVTAEPEEVGDGGRIQWVEGRPGETPVVAGTDFIIARDGRIAAIYLFFDKVPSAEQH